MARGFFVAIVEAYAAGKIDLPKPRALEEQKKKGKIEAIKGGDGIRLAPSFLVTKVVFKDIKNHPLAEPYNAESIADFLGWMSGKQVDPRVRVGL